MEKETETKIYKAEHKATTYRRKDAKIVQVREGIRREKLEENSQLPVVLLISAAPATLIQCSSASG